MFEPINHFELETPVDSISAVLTTLVEVGATPASRRCNNPSERKEYLLHALNRI